MEINFEYPKTFIDQFLNFLHEIKAELLDNWLTLIDVSVGNPFYKDILANCEKTIELLGQFIATKNIEPIIELTKKIARERIEANISLSDLVYNINIGRALVNEYVLKSKALHKENHLIAMMAVDQMFNHFMFHFIKEYNDVKDSILLNKNQFIKEMHHDRLTILGQIAASFAHEFRNPLTSIKGFIKMLEQKYKGDSESSFYFDIINFEMESLQDKVSRFLYLSKSKGLDDEMTLFDLSDVTKKMIEFMYPRFADENIEVITSIKGRCMIFAVKEQIKQIILNILNNAVEELTEQALNRTIEIELARVGNFIELKISNNGKMIPEYLIENIFEPFVTTKSLGTGLGLSVVKQIVEKHEGSIEVVSNENITTFIIKWKALTDQTKNVVG